MKRFIDRSVGAYFLAHPLYFYVSACVREMATIVSSLRFALALSRQVSLSNLTWRQQVPALWLAVGCQAVLANNHDCHQNDMNLNEPRLQAEKFSRLIFIGYLQQWLRHPPGSHAAVGRRHLTRARNARTSGSDDDANDDDDDLWWTAVYISRWCRCQLMNSLLKAEERSKSHRMKW